MMVLKKLVVVGDKECGKTWLLTVFAKLMRVSEHHVPDFFENFRTELPVPGTKVRFDLWEIPVEEDYKQRQRRFFKADVILMCFSYDSLKSLENIVEKWDGEVKIFCPGIPTILVGNKVDTKNKNQEIVWLSKYIKVAHSIKPNRFVDCSALKTDVLDVFQAAAHVATLKPGFLSKKPKCAIS